MADSWNWPALINKIAQDVPFLQRALNALLKQDPTSIEDAPSGAKRLYEVSSGKWQWQEYNGSSWAAVPFLHHNVDQLDGYHAAITPAANTVAVRNASGLLQDSITGNAATASSAATLSQTLSVNKGGTGATTSEAARANLGVPPTSHSSTATTYGVGNSTQYGHLKLSDATDSASGASGGVAATPAAVKAAKDAADTAQSAANTAQSAADAAMDKATTEASTSKQGIVQLNDTVTSTSTTQAATANAVKKTYDKASELNWIGVPRYWRSTNLPPNHCWANGDFVEFADWPELEQVYNAGGFAGMLMAWDADSETQAANLGQWRPDAAEPTGLYVPNLTGQFLRSWTQGAGEAGRSAVDTGRKVSGSIIVGTKAKGSISTINGSGALSSIGSAPHITGGGETSSGPYGISLDSSQSWGTEHTGDEFAPKHVCLPMIIYLGNPA